MKIDQLKDFNEVVKYYSEILEFVKKIKQKPNNVRYVAQDFLKFERLSNLSNIAPYRILASNISLYISQVHEKTKDMKDKSLLDATFSEMNSLNEIKSKNEELTLSEKKTQIRNCLAHADYHIVIGDIEKYDLSNIFDSEAEATSAMLYLEIENEKIKGKILFEELNKIAEKYQEAYAYMKHGYDVTFLLTMNPKNKIRTEEEYFDKIKRIRIIRKKDESGKTFEKFKYWFVKNTKITKEEQAYIENILELTKQEFKSFDILEEELRPESKAFIRKYIKYIGLKEILYSTNANKALNELNAANNENMLPIELLTGIVSTIDLLKKQNNILGVNPGYIFDESFLKTMNEKINELVKYSYQAPMIYANNLLGMSYYMFDYTKEINEKSEKNYFDYYNIKNLDEIKAYVEDKNGNKEQVPIQYNPLDKLQNRLNDVHSEINKLIKEKEKRENTKRSLENPKNKNPNKQKIIEAINEWMENYSEEEKKLIDKKSNIEKEIEAEKAKGINNKDSIDFFRHLRNSMAHGNYSIIYGDLEKVEDIKYCFKDKDEKNNSIYSVELTSKQLEKILQAFQLKVNECDKGYLDGKKLEKDILEYALKEFRIGANEVNQELIPKEKNVEEKGDEGIAEQK